MLSQIPGISNVTAVAIMQYFKTLPNLIQQCNKDEECLKTMTYTNEKGQTKRLNKTCIQNILTYLVQSTTE